MAVAPARWCAHPRIQTGEAFSSWLHRAAWANGLGNHSFSRRLLGEEPVWTRDLDRWATRALCETAAEGMGEHTERLRHGTLQHYEGRVFARLTPSGWLPWVTPVGVYHRTRRHAGAGYCPDCLREHGYASLRWRLAFDVICVRHRRWLLDTCTRCGAVFQFHRIDFSTPGRFPCPECQANLGGALPRPPLSRHALAMQYLLHGVLRRHGCVTEGRPVSPIDFFSGTRLLLLHVWPDTQSTGLIDAWPRHARARLPLQPPKTPFEYWPLQQRAIGLRALYPYLTDWPDRFIHDVRRSGMYASRVEAPAACPWPEWLSHALQRARPATRR